MMALDTWAETCCTPTLNHKNDSCDWRLPSLLLSVGPLKDSCSHLLRVKQVGLQLSTQADPVYKVWCFNYVTGDGQSPEKQECRGMNRCVLSLREPARLIPESLSCRDPCSHQGLRLTPGTGIGGRGLFWYAGRRVANTNRKKRSRTLT